MSKYMVDGTELTGIANAIRAKTGSSSQIEFPTGFTTSIGTLTKTSDADATASDILYGKTAYVNGSKITGSYRFNTAIDTEKSFTLEVTLSSSLTVTTTGVEMVIGNFGYSYTVPAVPVLTSLIVGGVDKTNDFAVKNLKALGDDSKIRLYKKTGSETFSAGTMVLTFTFHDLYLLYSV